MLSQHAMSMFELVMVGLHKSRLHLLCRTNGVDAGEIGQARGQLDIIAICIEEVLRFRSCLIHRWGVLSYSILYGAQ